MVKIREEQIYPVASPLGLEIPTPEGILEALQNAEDKAPLFFMLGNLYLIAEDFLLAVEAFEKAVEISEPNAKLFCNWGVALKLLGRTGEARKNFEQSILIDPEAVISLMHLGRLQKDSHQFDAARATFEKVLSINESHAEALTELGFLLDQQGELEEALVCLKKAYQLDSNAYRARNRLGRDFFLEGQALLEKGLFADAFQKWADGENLYPLSFSSDQIINREMRRLIEESKEEDIVGKLFEEMRPAIANKSASEQQYYELFSKFFFSLGLQPFAFEKAEELDLARGRWKQSLEKRGEHPFPHYRFGLLYCYQGEFEKALDELLYCEDNLPRAKQVSLKLGEVSSFVKKLYRLQMTEVGLEPGSEPLEKWQAAGFSDPFQVRAWSKTAAPPLEAREWKDRKFTPDSAKAWRKLRLRPEEAEKWRQAGFRASGDVRLWSLAGVAPEVAQAWSKDFRHDVSLAIQSLNSDITDPLEANDWLDVFQFPSEASKWKEQDFTPDEARSFLEKGISDPFIARKSQG